MQFVFFGGGGWYINIVFYHQLQNRKKTCLGCKFTQSVYEKKYFQAVVSSPCPVRRLNPRISWANFGAGDVGKL